MEPDLPARWLSLPALSLEEAQARWGAHPWPELIRHRVVHYPHRGSPERVVSHVCTSREEAVRYIAQLRALGVRIHGPAHRYDLRIRRTKLPPSLVLVKVRIPVLLRWYEPPFMVPVIALVYLPSGRVTAHFDDEHRRRFPSIAACLANYHRSTAWLADAEAFHVSGEHR